VARHEDEVGDDDLIVFLKTYEEATCGVPSGCVFTWEDVAHITQYSVAFDASLDHYVLSFVGIDLGASLTNTEVYIDNFKQEVVLANDQFLKIKIANVLSSYTLNIKINLPTGYPNSDTTSLLTEGITLDPRLHNVQPSIGSLGGSLIIAEVRGVGVNSLAVTLLTQDGIDICQEVKIPKYGQVLCRTKENLAIAQTTL
jgi:hypothetical protein